MKISTRCRYGARAVLELARGWESGKIVRRSEIAQRQGISEAYLENILIALKAAGIVRTVRGAGGGFTLSRPPETISLLDVFRALEGEIVPVECTVKEQGCVRSMSCKMRQVYLRLKEVQMQVLLQYTLRDLAGTRNRDDGLDFCI